MMFVTLTCLPPSCSAMLPQKFSAATTWITFDADPPAPAAAGPGAGAVLQPARAARAVTATAATQADFLRTPMAPSRRQAAGVDALTIMTSDFITEVNRG